MAAKGVSRAQSNGPSEKTYNGTQVAKTGQASAKKKQDDYTSEGVSDHDIFALPSSDYQLLGVLTLVAAFVRLFRIYQPSSVVFDEVQYGSFDSWTTNSMLIQLTASVASPRNTSKAASSWTYIPHWPSYS